MGEVTGRVGEGEGEGGEARFVSCSMYVRSSPF